MRTSATAWVTGVRKEETVTPIFMPGWAAHELTYWVFRDPATFLIPVSTDSLVTPDCVRIELRTYDLKRHSQSGRRPPEFDFILDWDTFRKSHADFEDWRGEKRTAGVSLLHLLTIYFTILTARFLIRSVHAVFLVVTAPRVRNANTLNPLTSKLVNFTCAIT